MVNESRRTDRDKSKEPWGRGLTKITNAGEEPMTKGRIRGKKITGNLQKRRNNGSNQADERLIFRKMQIRKGL